MHAIGICRFSFPFDRAFQRSVYDTTEKFDAHLYAPDRMKHRFWHFENLTLPSIMAQTDKTVYLSCLHRRTDAQNLSGTP